MPEYVYQTKGVCSTHIYFTLNNGILINVRFEAGCEGNLQAISRLLEGMPVAEAIKRLRGIDCEGRGSSCPDQLARALEEVVKGNKN